MSPKTFMLIAGELAAEQRAIVAHSASYGKPCHQISQAPAGAKENYSIAQIVCRAIRRLKILTLCSHGAGHGSDRPQISKAPAGAAENHDSTSHFFRPIRGLNRFANIHPTVVTVGYYRTLLRSLILWPTPSPIC